MLIRHIVDCLAEEGYEVVAIPGVLSDDKKVRLKAISLKIRMENDAIIKVETPNVTLFGFKDGIKERRCYDLPARVLYKLASPIVRCLKKRGLKVSYIPEKPRSVKDAIRAMHSIVNARYLILIDAAPKIILEEVY